jgi:hypothetical protein
MAGFACSLECFKAFLKNGISGKLILRGKNVCVKSF